MSDNSGDRPPSAGSSAAATSQAIDLQTALALARASARVLLDSTSNLAPRMRGELRKEAVGLDMRGGGEASAAAAAIRRMLDDA